MVSATPARVLEPAKTDMFPEADEAVIEVMFTVVEPERVMFPAAERFPVGVMEVPPLMVKVPLVAVSDPAPE